MYLSSKNMLYFATIVGKHCKNMEHSYKKHPCDHENKNVMFIHKSKYMMGNTNLDAINLMHVHYFSLWDLNLNIFF
jgi:hypothetical protein